MKRVGILFGMENTFPTALVDRINRAAPDVHADWMKVGSPRSSQASGYDVIIDRASREVPFYRPFLKTAALNGTIVLNDPFGIATDDRFFPYGLADSLGMQVPRAALLPSKLHPPQTTAQSMRNLEYPLGWKELFTDVGFPALLKPVWGTYPGRATLVFNEAEFFAAYDRSGDAVMTLQQAFPAAAYFRCYCVGPKRARLLPTAPPVPLVKPRDGISSPINGDLERTIVNNSLLLTRALGLDINAVEFAVQDGAAFVIDLLDPVPDGEYYSVGPEHFTWFVDAVAELAVACAVRPGHRKAVGQRSGFPPPSASAHVPKRRTPRESSRRKRS
jgi:hypothetical protein